MPPFWDESESECGIKRAAQYIRMSTEMQQYSVENQALQIGAYAAARGIAIVRTYTDGARSGLHLKGRPALTQLIDDVCAGRGDFNLILVYDISRWGRFQNVDESAHYEFLCNRAGVSVVYCAEIFENDGSLPTSVMKNIKRAMAGEYSRELSARVFSAKCNMVRRGFRHGGRAGYGMRRVLVDENGNIRTVLEQGQQKFLHSDRVILVPGPPNEVEVVRTIFRQFVCEKARLVDIVHDLNRQGILNAYGRPWVANAVRDLLVNEKYIGTNVFNRTSAKLRGRCVRNPRSQWVRAENAFEALVSKDVFEAAQKQLRVNQIGYTDADLLNYLTALWCQRGRLSSPIIKSSRYCPSSGSFRCHFGSLLTAFERIGYRDRRDRLSYMQWREQIAEDLINQLQERGHVVKSERWCDRSRLTVNDELRVAILLAHVNYQTTTNEYRWGVRVSKGCPADILVIARLSPNRSELFDYLIVPHVVVKERALLLGEVSPLHLERFRTKDLNPLLRMVERQLLPATRYVRSAKLTPQIPRWPKPPQAKSFASATKNSAARNLRSFYARYFETLASFVATAELASFGCRHIEATMAPLIWDSSFRSILANQGLTSLPRSLARALQERPEDVNVAQV